MLGTRERTLLLESLRPPAGYRLRRAVGTSFTLDLMALLTAPLAFTFFDAHDDEGVTLADPVALLEALRRHAEKITLFCQAGAIGVPKPQQRLMAYLEGSVFEVEARSEGGIFHPKIWVLNFEASDRSAIYRVLCLSRNLTFARAWDTCLRLEGRLTRRQRGCSPQIRCIGQLRALLAEVCVTALEPDLVIIDEFQRFKHLLDGGDATSRLARHLFNYSDDTADVRLLLLSATPYRMYTLHHESAEDDHYRDFLRTVEFLDPELKEMRRAPRLSGRLPAGDVPDRRRDRAAGTDKGKDRDAAPAGHVADRATAGIHRIGRDAARSPMRGP